MSGIIKGAGEPQSMPVSRKMANGRLSPTSPLKVFGQAKKKINEIFVSLSEHIDESAMFVKTLENDSVCLVTPEQVKQFSKYQDKVKGIKEILKRDRMKVAFFGRTSNGKSSVINAMLRNKILPSGMGHTTNCFLQVEGADEEEAYFINEQEPDVRNPGLKNLSFMANAQSKAKLDNDTLIRICWPKERCSLLRDDVVLVDSPGIDVSPDLDGWIEKFCLDADVFVLVANAESTLMQTEKNFFHRVSERLSKPNIFILNNRWDASDSEMETMMEVKQQHMERNIQFLVDELKVATQQEAENRVFFVSAKEALAARVHRDIGTPTPALEMKDGFHMRLFEFENFERKFEECISQSAVETKFALHAQNGVEITKYVCRAMNTICTEAAVKREQVEKELRELSAHLEATNRHVKEMTEQIREKIHRMKEEVEVKVGSALSEEIKRLAVLVDTFEEQFTCEPVLLQNYKNKLNSHVESGLSTNLENRCNDALRSAVSETSAYMAEQLLVLIPPESRPREVSCTPNFEMKYRLECTKLCSDFQEDIEFQFSFGFTNMLRRYAGLRQSKQTIPYSLPFSSSTESLVARGAQGDESEIVVTLLNTFSSLYSRTTIGVIVLAGMLAKAIGWRLLAVMGVSYGVLYAYERITWTTGAKEKAFKRQYVEYASSKLRLIADFTSSNCSDQVQHELNTNFSRLLQQVEENCSDLKLDLQRLNNETQALDRASKQAVILKNKTQFTDNELTNFVMHYLRPESKL